MNTLDFIFIALLAIAALVGWKIKSLILLGLGFVFCLAPLIAYYTSPYLAPFVRQSGISAANAMPTAAFLCLAGASLLIMGLFKLLSSTFQVLMLGWLDRGFGAAMLAGGLFIAMAFTTPWILNSSRHLSHSKLVQNSFLVQKTFPSLETLPFP